MLGLIAAALASVNAAPTTGDALVARIKAVGARRVLEEDFNLDGGRGYATVETGSAQGIAVAVEMLSTVADAAYAEGLQSSLGTALQNHPDRVLPLVGTMPVLDAARICLPFLGIESKRRVVDVELRRTRAALNRPEAMRYPAQRQACLAQVALVEGKAR